MLLTKAETINDLIVRELSKSPHLTLDKLVRKIGKRDKQKITLQGWYKALKRLMESGVIVKEGKSYSLNVSWVVDVLRWSYNLNRTYIEKEKEPVIALPQKQGEKITFKLRDLLAMNSFWAHLLVYIASKKPKDRTIYGYNPHFWFYLAHSDVERQYNRSLNKFGIRTLLYIGSNSFLDRWNNQFFNKNNIIAYFAPKPLFKEKNKYVNYFGGYLIDVKLKKEQAEKIDQLFKKTSSLADLSQLEIISLFQEKSLSTITISKNTKKGEAFKRRIKRYF